MMKYLIILPVKLYQWILSPLLGKNCRYDPTCSSYMIQAIEAHGIKKGVVLGIKRFSKCHPFAKTHWNKTGGYDPVPEKQRK